MKSNIAYFSTVFSISILMSCNFHGKNNSKIAASDTLLTKTVLFPDNLLKINGLQFQKIDSFTFEIKDRTKIISIIDSNCPKCVIDQLNKIDSIFNSIFCDDEALIFVLNVNEKDSAYFMHNLYPLINAKGIILWDNNYNFERRNDLFTYDANLRTFMVNKNNRIIQYGNPVMNPAIINEYKEKLTASVE